MNPTRPQILIGSTDKDYYLLLVHILESEGFQVILDLGSRRSSISQARTMSERSFLIVDREKSGLLQLA
ncbi:hypothetical protein SAMN04244575_06245 [Sinorhizobium meliloti]|nr:hypothetical protein SAMN04244575_06245 [Sinorhizobium meliloti]